MKECQVEQNRADCACTYQACGRRGICCDCVAYHRKNNEIPGCLFPPAWEKKYDRSLKAFLAAHGR